MLGALFRGLAAGARSARVATDVLVVRPAEMLVARATLATVDRALTSR
jgi:hypothetical protein